MALNKSWRTYPQKLQGISGTVIVLITVGIIMCGCILKSQSISSAPDFFLLTNELSRQLSLHLKGPEAGEIIMTTIVDLDDFSTPTGLGRTMTETLATTLFRYGFNVVEIRNADELMIKKSGGELILTRDINRLTSQYQATTILAGTYSVTPATVIINLRMLRNGSHEIMAVAGVELPRTKAINHLLATRGNSQEPALSAYER